jgi:hypothetical protein
VLGAGSTFTVEIPLRVRTRAGRTEALTVEGPPLAADRRLA